MNLSRSARTFLQSLIIPAWWIIALFGSAGHLAWERGWICTAVYLGSMYISRAVLNTVSPALLQNREETIRKGTKPFDRLFLRSFLFLIIVLPVIAGLDVMRFRWSALPFWTTYPGIAFLAAAVLLITWTLAKNPHAESSVRIQNDRGQAVITTGPYRFVRHPMYVGLTLLHVSMSLILGSAGVFCVAAAIALLLFWRTALEDRTLRQELPGYEDYTSITRYRLMPGIW
jgi:protein-S-isoprenylcysteine O-methyltransferase Ste14